jgi:hypothetical protein
VRRGRSSGYQIVVSFRSNRLRAWSLLREFCSCSRRLSAQVGFAAPSNRSRSAISFQPLSNPLLLPSRANFADLPFLVNGIGPWPLPA